MSIVGSVLSGRARRVAALVAAAASVAPACGERERPPPLVDPGAGATAAGGSSLLDAGNHDGPPAPDASGLCGNLIVPVVLDRPNLYFVVDRSGSMSEEVGDSGLNKYQAARKAILDVLLDVGHRVRFGAAVFPATETGCSAGQQIFPTVAGDDPEWAEKQEYGPVLLALNDELAMIPVDGGTPTAATLIALAPTLTALEGETAVVLMTDGAPNCNPALSCEADQCIANIEGFAYGGTPCAEQFNCCDPALVPTGQTLCLDGDETEAAVAALGEADIDTYVVGMPGTEAYAELLDRMAEAGGTARAGSPAYYATTDAEELTDALREIGTGVAISCTLDLGEEPPDPLLVNVYLDTKLVAQDADDGWSWVDADTLELNGEACAELKSGDVIQVQVVAGCPTVVR